MSNPDPSTAAVSDANAVFDRASLKESAFTWRAAFSLAVASDTAYKTEKEVRNIGMSEWGFDSCDLLESGSTQCLVAQDKQLVLLAFRGTESVADALKDGNVLPTQTEAGAVHTGFFNGVESIEPGIKSQIGQLGARTLVLTGHSLGGALAVIAAGKWRDEMPIQWLATYGQPAVGDHAFRDNLFRSYAGRYFRFVNNADIVTRVPPGYVHAGRLLQFSKEGPLVVGTTLPKTAPPKKVSSSPLAGFAATVTELANAALSSSEEWQLGAPMVSPKELKQLRETLHGKLHLGAGDLLDKIPSDRSLKESPPSPSRRKSRLRRWESAIFSIR